MVTTRRQSHGLPTKESRDGSELDTPRNISNKRKSKSKRNELGISPLLPAKRRKTSLDHLDHDGHNPSGKSVSTSPEQRRPTVQVVIAVDDRTEGHEQEEKSLGSVTQKSYSKEEQDGAGKGGYDTTPGVKPREQLVPSTDNNANPNRDPQDDQLRVKAPELTVTPSGETTGTAGISKTPKAIHFRFGSEEPEVNAMNLNERQSHADALSVSVVEKSEESDTEDEAPEIITASMGAETAKARSKDADRAAERQRATAKEKRRERNDLLSQQAQSSKKAKKRKAFETSDDKPELDDVADSAPSHARTIARHRLPALLPDDILAAEPAVRSATPPLEQEPSKKPKPRKHVFVETDPKPPKDIKLGPVKVRVLEGGRQNLPPKASKESRNLKEAWLGGRRGRNGAAIMERRKVGFGFARK